MTKPKSGANQQKMHREPLHVRRKLAEAYRRQAQNSRWTEQERATFARMADAWQASLAKE